MKYAVIGLLIVAVYTALILLAAQCIDIGNQRDEDDEP